MVSALRPSHDGPHRLSLVIPTPTSELKGERANCKSARAKIPPHPTTPFSCLLRANNSAATDFLQIDCNVLGTRLIQPIINANLTDPISV